MAEFVDKRINDFTETATEGDLVAGSYFALDTADKTKRLSVDTLNSLWGDRVLHLVGIAGTSTKAGVTKDGDIFFNTSTGRIRRCVNFSRNVFETIPFYEGAIYQFNGFLYYYNGSTLEKVKQDEIDTYIFEKKIFAENLVTYGMDENEFSAVPLSKFYKVEAQTNYCKCVHSSTGNTSRLQYLPSTMSGKFASGHIYYVVCDVKPSSVSYVKIYIGDGNGQTEVFNANEWNRISALKKITSNNEIGVYVNSTNRNVVDEFAEFKNYAIFDVSAMFGEGNEPTKEYLDEIFYNKTFEKSISFDVNKKENLYKYDEVTFCDKQCVEKSGCVVCNGFADDVKIKQYLDNPNYKKLVFKTGSVFNISAPLSVRRNLLTVEGFGAKFNMAAVAEFEITKVNKSSNGLDWIVHFSKTSGNVAEVEKFYNGVQVEVYNTDATQNDHTSHGTSRITNSQEAVGQFRLAPTTDSYGFKNYAFKTGAKIRSVSSIFDVMNCKNVVVRGVECNLNVQNNPRSYDAFDTQNGLHFYLCENCTIEDSFLHDGGRHGILFSSSKECCVKRCTLDNWGEHGIDLAWHTNNIEPCYHEAIGNTCVNNRLCGIQLHRGSNSIVVNNVCRNNGKAGIGLQEGASNDIISNNILEGNQDGIYAVTNVSKCVFEGNKISASTRNGIEIESACSNIMVEGNFIHESHWNGIRCTVNCSKICINNNLVTDSECADSSDHNIDIQLKNTTLSVVSSNTIRNEVSTTTYALGENGTDSAKNIFCENNVFGKDKVIGSISSSSVSRNNVSFV